jgi:aminomethyltransferase
MALRTPLYDRHVRLGARLVDFGGWEMPLHYGSQIEEHNAVRAACGVFDVSHMRAIDVDGEQARPFLGHLLANDVARLIRPGQALYSCMLNDHGGVVDDLLVYLRPSGFRLVVNAGTAASDVRWMNEKATPFDVRLTERVDLAILAIQGPQAIAQIGVWAQSAGATEAIRALQFFEANEFGDRFCSRTGYTGEDGYELILPTEQAGDVWDGLIESGAAPCGLGCRDTLRLEAGMNLYGQDMDASTSPFEAGLAWTVSMKSSRQFIGRAALESMQAGGVTQRQVGLLLEDPGILRAHMPVITKTGNGLTTSGGYSPTLGRSIALARIPVGETEGRADIEVRGKLLKARIVQPPFVRRGKVQIAL